MKSPFVSEMELDKVVTTSFQVYSKQVREKKTGEPFLSLVLADRTGKVDAKMWDNVHEVKDTFETGDFVKVRGCLQVYNNRRQLTIQKLRRLELHEVDPADYLPSCTRNPEEMFGELQGIVEGIQNPHLRALLKLFLEDEDIAARYRRAPAAKQIHHAYLGGLLDHVLSLCNLCRLTVQNYKNVDLDLLLAGAILHDIGKLYELGYETSFGYTNEGQLLGHIAMAVRLIEQKACKLPGFPTRLRNLLEHMVLSHHGQLEFGSPKVPLFPEALLLHYLDDLDSKMECMRSLVENDLNGDKHWTAYSASLERMVLKKEQYLVADEAQAIPKPAASAPAVHTSPDSQRHAPAPNGSPRPADPVHPPRTGGLFGEKLLEALKGE